MEVWLSRRSVASASRSSYPLPLTGSERIIPYNGCSSKLLLEKKAPSFIWQGLTFHDIIIAHLYRLYRNSGAGVVQ